MFKNADGRPKFSFTRFMGNAAPPVAGPPQNTDLSIGEQDAVFLYQLQEAKSQLLGPQACLHAGVTLEAKLSANMQEELFKMGVLQETSPWVNTDKITSTFVHKFPTITSHQQKKLINLLFFWEDELRRWTALSQERESLTKKIEAQDQDEGEAAIHRKRLEELASLVNLQPSLRSK